MKSRPWVSLLTGFFFVVLSITGIALLVHVRIDSLKMLHELAGLAFVIIGVVHLVFNRRCLVSYFGDRRALIALTAAVVLCGILIVHAGEIHSRHHGPEGAPPRERID